MSVEDRLGMRTGSRLLAGASQRWTTWTTHYRILGEVGDFDQLRGWLRAASRHAADEVLLALATLAASDGGDDVDAAAALAWAMVPGAGRVAAQLRTLSRAVVAGGPQLPVAPG
jgi:hypothetical protein